MTNVVIRWGSVLPAHPRFRLYVAIAAFSLISLSLFSYRTEGYNWKPGRLVGDSFTLEDKIETWRNLQLLLIQNDPKCSPPERIDISDISWGFNGDLHSERPQRLRMSAEDIESMKTTHANFVKAISTLNAPKLRYKRGTRGIVTTAGGKHLPILAISLRMLRRTGSTLPVEVLMASRDEYEPATCDVILPSLGATCVVLSDILDAVPLPSNYDIKKYQYKIFSILFSSFEDVMLLDSDAFPVHDPATLFSTEPFLSKGLVLWPDFWYSTESPYYFEISATTPPPLQSRASTESGEMLYSKSKHATSILLATYYNFYGPDYYYPLLSQGAPGEGDKETFQAAALALNLPFYKVRDYVRAIGVVDPVEDSFHGNAMVQSDPISDFRSSTDLSSHSSQAPKSPPFIIHANYPKFDPATIFDDYSTDATLKSPTKDPDGNFWRVWGGSEDIMNTFDTDIEQDFWREVQWVACELSGKFRWWSRIGSDGNCRGVTAYFDSVFRDT